VYWIIGVIAAAIFSADLFIKTFLRQHHAYQSMPVIPGILHLTIVFNKGAAFGILNGQTLFLTCISVIFIIMFTFFIRQENKKNLVFFIACGLIVGGAASNFYDRLVLGYVVDYIDVRIWPVFNLSDTCISVGAGLLFLDSLKKNKHRKEPPTKTRNI
jgi:signal peptidase II